MRLRACKIIKNSVNAQIYIFLPFSYSILPKIAMHRRCGAKKYRFGSTIVGYILVFGDAKNSNITI